MEEFLPQKDMFLIDDLVKGRSPEPNDAARCVASGTTVPPGPTCLTG